MAAVSKPVAGRDYPTNWDQFLEWFPDNAACLEYLEDVRWPEGFVCPLCQEQGEPYRGSRFRLVCRRCRHQTTVTSGTIFDKTRTALTSWFAAVWYVTSQKHGVSALGLQRALGLGSYQTAWALLHRLRRAMVRQDRDRLNGVVEVDELFLAGPVHLSPRWRSRYPGRSKQQLKSLMSIVAAAVEIREPKGLGRVRLRRITEASVESLHPFVRDNIEPGTMVRTDGSHAYKFLSDQGYAHERCVHLGATEPPHISMPGVNRIASLLQRWLLGTHQGSVRPHQLDYYLDEYAFRFNRRQSRSQGMLFYRLIQQAVLTGPLTYKDIAGGAKQ